MWRPSTTRTGTRTRCTRRDRVTGCAAEESRVVAGPLPSRPVVRVVDPRRPGPAPAPAPPRLPRSAATRRRVWAAVTGAGALLLALGVADLHRAQEAARSAQVQAQGLASLRLEVVGAQTAQAVPVTGAPVQEARVVLSVLNAGPAPVRLLDARLDGNGPVTPADPAPVRAGGVALLPTVWRVRCQEVGGLTGPFVLDIGVALADGSTVPYRVDLQPVTAPDGPARSYRAAALRSCISLVTG